MKRPKRPRLGRMLDALERDCAGYTKRLFRAAETWTLQGRAARSRLCSTIAFDWDELVLKQSRQTDPPARGGSHARASTAKELLP
jgi:hypothetical protein